jgi:nucleoside-diphosphate-sugar epimerase
LVIKLIDDGHEILQLSRSQSSENIVKGDLSKPSIWINRVKEFDPHTTIHLAWEGIPDFGFETSFINFSNGIKLLRTLKKIHCERIICTGSCWEYGRNNGKLHEQLIPKSTNSFTAAKNALHSMGKEFASESSIEFIWTRLFYVYGPGQRRTSLIPYIIDCISKKKHPNLQTPYSRNDFVYIDDVTSAISSLLNTKSRYNTYNIGSGISTSVEEITKLVYNHFKFNSELKNKKDCPPNSINYYADISKINQDTGWRPRFEIKKGINKMIAHLLSSQ